MRQLWPRWTLTATWPLAGFFGGVLVLGPLRWELGLLLVLILGLAYGNAWTKKLYVGLYPFAVAVLMYELMRLYNAASKPRVVHLCDLRDFEIRLLGFAPNDWMQARAWLPLDLFFAVFYGIFLYVVIAYGVYLFFRSFDEMQVLGWSFMVVSLIGYVTYQLYPAAPPWYFHAHGCAIDPVALASEGPNLARVDAFLGWGYFRGLYGRSGEVFGAVPSLHVGYALLILPIGRRNKSGPGRALGWLFVGSMAIAAVYLDHHWVIDVVLGAVYALVAVAVVRLGFRVTRVRPGVGTETALPGASPGGMSHEPTDPNPGLRAGSLSRR